MDTSLTNVRVVTHSIKTRPELNGRTATALYYSSERKRWATLLDGDAKPGLMLAKNLKLLDDPAPVSAAPVSPIPTARADEAPPETPLRSMDEDESKATMEAYVAQMEAEAKSVAAAAMEAEAMRAAAAAAEAEEDVARAAAVATTVEALVSQAAVAAAAAKEAEAAATMESMAPPLPPTVLDQAADEAWAQQKAAAEQSWTAEPPAAAPQGITPESFMAAALETTKQQQGSPQPVALPPLMVWLVRAFKCEACVGMEAPPLTASFVLEPTPKQTTAFVV